MDLFETLAEATRPEHLTKEFKVVAVSDNTNSFGLRQMIMVAKDGTAYKGCFNYLNVKKQGETITGYVILTNGLEKRIEFTGGELVEQIENAPEEVINELFN